MMASVLKGFGVRVKGFVNWNEYSLQEGLEG